MVENEENVNELEENSTKSTATDDQTETTDQKEETSPSAEPVVPIVESENQAYTHDLIETKNFTLQIDHHMTSGDMLVSMLLAANMAVMLLCRLLRDRK